MNNIITLTTFLLLTVAPLALLHADDAFIVKNGESRAEIVIAEAPPRTVRLAADDLRTYIEKICGARLPIVTQPTGTAVKLFVGRSLHTDTLGITAEGLEYGAYRIVAGPDWMVFLGDDTDFMPREPWPRNSGSIRSGRLQQDWEAAAGGSWRAPNPGM